MRFSTGITSLDIIFGALACVLVHRLVTLKRRVPKGLRLPPGPPGKFVLGNIFDIPKDNFLETFNQWAKEYGELVHIHLLGQSVIFVNSLDIAHELFEKRSSKYSDRNHIPMLIDLMGWDWNFAFMPYGDWWRRHRRTFHQQFNAEAVTVYHDVETRQTRAFLRRLQESPAEFVDHIRHLAGATILEIIYGIKVLPKGDPYIEMAEIAMATASDAGSPGKFLVNVFPFLQYVPEWMPGAGFRRKAREWKVTTMQMLLKPFMAVKDSLDAGHAQPSVVATMLEDLSRRTDAPADEETIVRNVAGVAYAAGADTTVSALITFTLAMVLYPEVQRKAQAELDAVIGNRLPVFEDFSSLPYVTAVCKEVHRWHATVPLGIPRCLKQDDVYKDYFIPRGSIIIGYATAILQDEKTYGPNPEAFRPERFLRPGAIDPVGHFGFGRRICAGRYMADDSISLAVASLLKVFDISPATDENGEKIPVAASFDSGLISFADPFRCTINPRSDSTQVLLQADD